MLKITLTSGLVAKKTSQRKVVEALGLGKQNSSVLRADTPVIRGMINKVHHLVSVEPLEILKVEEIKKRSAGKK